MFIATPNTYELALIPLVDTLSMEIDSKYKDTLGPAWDGLRRAYPLLDAKLGKEIRYNENYQGNPALDVTELSKEHVVRFPKKPLVQTVCEFVNWYMRKTKGGPATQAEDNCSMLAYVHQEEKLVVVLALSHGFTDMIVSINLLKQLLVLMSGQQITTNPWRQLHNLPGHVIPSAPGPWVETNTLQANPLRFRYRSQAKEPIRRSQQMVFDRATFAQILAAIKKLKVSLQGMLMYADFYSRKETLKMDDPQKRVAFMCPVSMRTMRISVRRDCSAMRSHTEDFGLLVEPLIFLVPLAELTDPNTSMRALTDRVRNKTDYDFQLWRWTVFVEKSGPLNWRSTLMTSCTGKCTLEGPIEVKNVSFIGDTAADNPQCDSPHYLDCFAFAGGLCCCWSYPLTVEERNMEEVVESFKNFILTLVK